MLTLNFKHSIIVLKRHYDIIILSYYSHGGHIMIPISICVIAKNEEKHMERFLSSIKNHFKNYPYELIIVDTGSTDHTVEICEKYVTKVYHFKWINDFSAARNYSLQCASCNWILVLDCDEYISSLDTSCFSQMISMHPNAVGLITRKNHCHSNNQADKIYTDETNRFFNKNHYHYEDIIHEQLCANNGLPYEMLSLPICVDHFGYASSSDELQKKAERNNNLLFKMLENDPSDPYIYFQIGQSFNLIDDAEKAAYYYKKGLELSPDPHLEYVQLMVNAYGYALLDLGRTEEALSLENLYDQFSDTAEFVCLMGLIYLRNNLPIKAMKEFLKATTFKSCSVEGANTYTPLYNMGYINELLGNTKAAIQLYKNCGDFPPALDHLKNLNAL